MSYALPIVIAAALWWTSTGAIFALARLPRATWRWTAIAATCLGLAGTMAVLLLRPTETTTGAYAGFLAGLVMWGWHETLFLLGYVTGARKTPCPPDLSLSARFRASAETVLHHEIAIALHAMVILAFSWGAANQTAALTFLLLWIMRLSVKFILFFGAPNIPAEALPTHLRYLASYFRRSQSSRFLPVAFAFSVAIALALGIEALSHAPGDYGFTAYGLLATLASLAVLEHAALRLRLPDRLLGVWTSQSEKDLAAVRPTSARTAP